MNLPSNLSKSSVLAAVVFWVIIGVKDFNSDMIPFMLLSFIPIFLMVTVVILLTICPFFWLKENPNFNKKNVFKTYFPFYTIIIFSICIYGIICSGYDTYLIAFFSSVYITTNQSWFWFAKEKTHAST